MAVIRKRTTVFLDAELLRAVKDLAASAGRPDYEIVEDALRQYFSTPKAEESRAALRDLLAQLGSQNDVGDDQALDLAYNELHAVRRGQR